MDGREARPLAASREAPATGHAAAGMAVAGGQPLAVRLLWSAERLLRAVTPSRLCLTTPTSMTEAGAWYFSSASECDPHA
eukprot:9470830-Pyramimonas_sp.AAC.1